MDRKKFFALISTSLLGAVLLGAIPLNFFKSKSNSKKSNSIKVKINPNAVNREKSGKKNG